MRELVTSTLQAGFGTLKAQGQRGGRALQRNMQKHGILRYGLSGAIALVLIIGVAFLTTQASYVNVLQNGDFEDGFHAESCGLVGNGWSCFTNGGAANYGYYDDQWNLTVASGAHSQLIEVNAKGIPAPDHDRFAGVYQTVRVLDWADYVLSLKGMIRTTVMDGDPWRYRVEVGWTDGKHADWTKVTNWQDVGWTTFYERTSPGSFSDYTTKFTAMDDYVTIYIRIWKKWGVPEEEIDLNLDYIGLTGPSVYGYGYAPAPAQPAPSQPYTKKDEYYKHEAPPVIDGSCQGADYIYNGSFEHGFNPVAIGHVGKGWGSFTNGGAAGYGFYDEQWPPVVSDGQHGQLIEINAKGFDVADNDRYAGIYQKIKGLQPGATYELTVNGLLRGTDPTDDPYRYEVQWGYNPGGNWDWQHVANWAGMDVGQIYPRTEPGAMGTYRVRFTASSHHMVLFIRGWKKWGVPGSEMDLNLDNIRLRGCAGGGHKPSKPGHDGGYPHDGGRGDCTYVVRPGDTLGAIAQRYNVWVNDLAYANGIADVNWIYVGQRLHIPGCNAGQPPAAVAPPVYAAPPTQHRIHVVKPGETLSQICAVYGTDAQAFINANGIVNPNLIFVGQELVIP